MGRIVDEEREETMSPVLDIQIDRYNREKIDRKNREKERQMEDRREETRSRV